MATGKFGKFGIGIVIINKYKTSFGIVVMDKDITGRRSIWWWDGI